MLGMLHGFIVPEIVMACVQISKDVSRHILNHLKFWCQSSPVQYLIRDTLVKMADSEIESKL